jgi:hypothetical protein
MPVQERPQHRLRGRVELPGVAERGEREGGWRLGGLRPLLRRRQGHEVEAPQRLGAPRELGEKRRQVRDVAAA